MSNAKKTSTSIPRKGRKDHNEKKKGHIPTTCISPPKT